MFLAEFGTEKNLDGQSNFAGLNDWICCNHKYSRFSGVKNKLEIWKPLMGRSPIKGIQQPIPKGPITL